MIEKGTAVGDGIASAVGRGADGSRGMVRVPGNGGPDVGFRVCSEGAGTGRALVRVCEGKNKQLASRREETGDEGSRRKANTHLCWPWSGRGHWPRRHSRCSCWDRDWSQGSPSPSPEAAGTCRWSRQAWLTWEKPWTAPIVDGEKERTGQRVKSDKGEAQEKEGRNVVIKALRQASGTVRRCVGRLGGGPVRQIRPRRQLECSSASSASAHQCRPPTSSQ